MTSRLFLACLATVVLATPLLKAQEASTTGGRRLFKVEYRFRDAAPSGTASDRRYLLTLESEGKGVFRSGNRVPYATGSFQGAGAGTSTQFNYADVGVNIDCRVRDVSGRLSVYTDLDLSTVAAASTGQIPAPTISQVRLQMTTSVVMGKPATVGTIDDPVTSRKLAIEVTVSPQE